MVNAQSSMVIIIVIHTNEHSLSGIWMDGMDE